MTESMPGRISGRRSGRKYFHMRGIDTVIAELETAMAESMPGRISGRKCGRKYFHMRGIDTVIAELE